MLAALVAVVMIINIDGQAAEGGKKAVVLVQKPNGAKSLSVDEGTDDTAIILGVMSSVVGGLITYAGLKRLGEVAFKEPKCADRDDCST